MSEAFRWQALFQKSRDALFVLNQRRQLIFANSAWESLTGRSLVDVRGFTCTGRKSGEDYADLARTLTPPPEVLSGQSARVQRPPPSRKTGPPWWEIDFLPLAGENGLVGVLGRIRAEPVASPISNLLTESQIELCNLVADRHRLESLDGQFPCLSTALAQARLAAASRTAVLIVGEPGVGKEWLARAIQCASPAKGRPFLALDAASLPAAAVTGALFGPLGLYRPDGAGTIYIHDPARLSLDVQDELAQRLAGGSPTDARVIVGSAELLSPSSTQLLPAFVSALSILIIRLPALRERTGELPTLTSMILERLSNQPIAVSPEAADCLSAYPWPGNIDELAVALQAALGEARGSRIETTHLPLAVRQARVAAELPPLAEPSLPALDQALADEERRLIRLALEKTKGNRARAAQLLSIWRPRLTRRIRALGIEDE